jgi:formate dehydrogenase subunit gamma
MRSIFRSVALALALTALGGAAVAQGDATKDDPVPPAAAPGASAVCAGRAAAERDQRPARQDPAGQQRALLGGVRNSGTAPGSVNNMQVGERGVLVQEFTQYPGTRLTTAGEAWRQMRNWWIIPIGGVIILLVVLVVALYYKWKGPIGGHGRHTGRLIERFTYFERTIHWTTAITFVILAVSGAVMSFGKFFLLPIIGGQLFGWLTWLLKTTHNFVGPLFAVSMVVMFFSYLPSNWPARADWQWLIRAGGMLGGEHPPSGRFNAGEKIVFWGGMVVLGVVVVASGFALDKIVPGLDLTRPQTQVVHIFHAARLDVSSSPCSSATPTWARSA